MANGILKIATCQFAVGGSIAGNAENITDFLHKAKDGGADIVHFSECSLSGYGGSDFDSFAGYDWDLLKAKTEKIIALAAELKIWIALGSTHRLNAPNKPHNCLYLINSEGEIVGRYDKRFATERDLAFYTPGNRFVTFELNSVKCALLICFDLRFPEVYRELKKMGVKCILQSFYNAGQNSDSIHRHIMQQTMQCRAATNYFWVSMANSCREYAPYASCFIQPDGEITKKLELNKPGVMINTVNTNAAFYDPTEKFRNATMGGKLTNGDGQIDDERSTNTTEL
ncbi:MAG: carbon-nitrogen hydrolase family protein [Anaerohalosphaeraceae bacterium]|nr:carbon-nitrogen hydrolase family protein [Anaerohalosphaeraceae bacterium]